MAEIEGVRRIERLGKGIALWGGLAGLLLWCAVLLLRGNLGLAELLFLVGVPVCGGVTLLGCGGFPRNTSILTA